MPRMGESRDRIRGGRMRGRSGVAGGSIPSDQL